MQKDISMPEHWEHPKNLVNYPTALFQKLKKMEKKGLLINSETNRILEENQISDCCGAKIINYTWCKDCHENC